MLLSRTSGQGTERIVPFVSGQGRERFIEPSKKFNTSHGGSVDCCLSLT